MHRRGDPQVVRQGQGVAVDEGAGDILRFELSRRTYDCFQQWRHPSTSFTTLAIEALLAVCARGARSCGHGRGRVQPSSHPLFGVTGTRRAVCLLLLMPANLYEAAQV